MIYESFDSAETYNFARRLGEKASKGEIYCLCGDLGTGKTVFAKGFARGLSVLDEVSSPTFNIVNVYEGTLPFYHFDVYRIKSESELEDTGFEDYVYGDGVCLIEWADMIKGIIPKHAVWIHLTKTPEKGGDYRQIAVLHAD